MIIILNNQRIDIDESIQTVEDLAQFKNLPEGGTAIALNGKLVRRPQWSNTELKPLDNLTIISAAYGG
jgi:thiamine biosynthesis protein ThiS